MKMISILISEWLVSNKLSLNSQKTKFMVFHSMQRKVKYPVITLSNTIIERVKLGIGRFITNQQNIYRVTPVHYLQKAEKKT